MRALAGLFARPGNESYRDKSRCLAKRVVRYWPYAADVPPRIIRLAKRPPGLETRARAQ